MIKNRRQYQIAKVQIEKFRKVLDNFQARAINFDPKTYLVLQETLVNGLENQIKFLSDRLIKYEQNSRTKKRAGILIGVFAG